MTILEQRAVSAICDIAEEKRREPDYWEKLTHQAAIAALQGMCVNPYWDDYKWSDVAANAKIVGERLVQKLREKSNEGDTAERRAQGC